MRKTRTLGLLALFGLGVACGGDGGGGGGGEGQSISRADGDNQTGNINASLSDSIVVSVTNDGAAQSGVTVSWAATGGGTASPPSSTTDANGLAATNWVLGSTPGPQTATATLSGASGSPVTFSSLAIGGTGVAFGNTFFRSNHNGTSDPAVDTVFTGQSITWNGVGGSHTVRSQGSPSFTSSTTLEGDDTYTVTFNNAGTYQYDCEIHGSQMSGRIVVRPGGT